MGRWQEKVGELKLTDKLIPKASQLPGKTMQWSKTVTVVGAHAEGEIGRVITAGVIDLPGATMREKLRYLQTENDELRRFVMNEPRGCARFPMPCRK